MLHKFRPQNLQGGYQIHYLVEYVNFQLVQYIEGFDLLVLFFLLYKMLHKAKPERSRLSYIFGHVIELSFF